MRLLAVLGLQGIVVKSTAAIVFRPVDWKSHNFQESLTT